MMVKLILYSINKIVRQKITNQEGAILVGTPPVRSINLILKLIMNKTIIDTRAASAVFRSDLSNFDSFMSSCNSNIETFSTHVNHAGGSLQARGERVDDLLTNIFKEYKVALDINFLARIDLWESNWMQEDDLTSELLMTKFLNDYNMKVMRRTWAQQSDDQHSIVALTADLQIIKDSNIQLSA